MTWWMWPLVFIYISGFVAVLWLHVERLGNVTLPYAVLRSALWPLWLATRGNLP